MRSALRVFDTRVKMMQKHRAAMLPQQSRICDYVKDEVAERMADRLLDIKRRFATVLDMGSGAGHLRKFLDRELISDQLVMLEQSETLLYRDSDDHHDHNQTTPSLDTLGVSEQQPVRCERLVWPVGDDGDDSKLPFPDQQFDAVLSSMSLHWTNNLPGLLKETCRVLRPDGAFIAAMIGGDSLFELRCSFQLAEQERKGGISPHISPFATAPDMAGLLADAGFNLTTIDMDEIVVNYPSPFELMQDLQMMAENNAVIKRQPVLSRDVLISMAAIYKEMYANSDGTVPATFQVINMIGWKPHPSQPLPLKPGSAKHSFKEMTPNE